MFSFRSLTLDKEKPDELPKVDGPVKGCPNTSNPYHTCVEYCRKRYGQNNTSAPPKVSKNNCVFHVQGRKKPRSHFLGQVNFALGQVKIEVWWSTGQVKFTSVVLLVIISHKKQFQYLRLQDEQNNELKAWINLKFNHA